MHSKSKPSLRFHMKEKIKGIIFNLINKTRAVIKKILSPTKWLLTIVLVIGAIIFIFKKEQGFLGILNMNSDNLLLLAPIFLLSLIFVIHSKNKPAIISSLSIVLAVFFFLIQEFNKNYQLLDNFYATNTSNCLRMNSLDNLNYQNKLVTLLDSSFYENNLSFIRSKFGDDNTEEFRNLIYKINYINSFLEEVAIINQSLATETNEEKINSGKDKINLLYTWIKETPVKNEIINFLCVSRFSPSFYIQKP